MSIEDINYLKQNSIRQSYTFLVDSKSRDRSIYPDANNYVVEFTTPFKYVIGLEVIDVSVPKTMYNIDYNNNILYYYLGTDVPIVIDENGKSVYDKSVFTSLEIPVGDYTTQTFINKVKSILFNQNIDLDISANDTPAELTNLIYFSSSQPFVLDMHSSTIAEVLGFDLYTDVKNDAVKYTYKDCNKDKGFEKLFHSYPESGMNIIRSPGMMYLIGNKYLVLRCKEIEEHLYRSLSYSKYNLGLAKIRINSYGYNDEKTSFMKIPLREFHPIGKLPRITLRFETDTGELYNFKGVNHNIVFAIYYYEPKYEYQVTPSILNPEYDPNYIKYLHKQEEQEGESDEEEEDFSRDDLEIYLKNQMNFNKKGIENNNVKVGFKKMQSDLLRPDQYKNEVIKQRMNLNRDLQKIESESEEESDNNDNESNASNASNTTNDTEDTDL